MPPFPPVPIVPPVAAPAEPPTPPSGSQSGIGQPQRLALGCPAGTQNSPTGHSVTRHVLVPLVPPPAPLTPPATTPPALVVPPTPPPAWPPFAVAPAPAVPPPGFNPDRLLHAGPSKRAAKRDTTPVDILHMGSSRWSIRQQSSCRSQRCGCGNDFLAPSLISVRAGSES